MGLHNQLTDLSAESLPALFLAIIAHCVATLRSFLLKLFHHSAAAPNPHEIDSPSPLPLPPHHLGSGLSGLLVLTEQLDLNATSSFSYSADADAGPGATDCMVCLCSFRDGEHVRRLDCRHVFHKECFDGWLNHLNFNCPLCRSSIVPEERVFPTRRRVGGDLAQWFSLHY